MLSLICFRSLEKVHHPAVGSTVRKKPVSIWREAWMFATSSETSERLIVRKVWSAAFCQLIVWGLGDVNHPS